jgi:uncharacterized protein YjbI with pentapeptide repeats
VVGTVSKKALLAPMDYHEDTTFEKDQLEHTKKVEFEYCNFQFCDFSAKDLTNTKFIDCTFNGCNFSNVAFNKTVLNNAKFNACKLIGLRFDLCSDFGLSFSFENCILNYSTFFQTKIKKTVLQIYLCIISF